MSRRSRRNVGNIRKARTVPNLDLSGSFIAAMGEGNLINVQNLVHSHGLSCCEGWYGSYALLRDAIESGHFEIAKFLLQEGSKVGCETNCVSTPLHFATEQRNLELVQLLLEKNAQVDAQNGKKETALHLAAKEGYAEIVEVLLNHNASVTMQTNTGSTPFLLAAKGLHEGVLRMLLRHTCASFKGENDQTPSVSAAENRHSTPLNRILLCDWRVRDGINKLVEHIVNKNSDKSQIIDDLIDHGFTMSRHYVNISFLHRAMSMNSPKLIKSVMTIANTEDAKHIFLLLYSAVKNEEKKMVNNFVNLAFELNFKSEDEDGSLRSDEDKLAKVVERLLASGADVRLAPHLLCIVVEQNLIEVCKILIRYGADFNARYTDCKTPLHRCCGEAENEDSRQKKDNIIKLLLNSAVDVNIEDQSQLTPFHCAAWNGREGAVSIFLDFGVNVDLRTKRGSTPLHSASEMGQTKIIEILVKNKANLEARNEKGWTPLHCAAFHLKTGAVETLLKLGADVEALGPNKETALYFTFAQRKYNDSIVKMLLKYGCDANARTNDGKTVMDFAWYGDPVRRPPPKIIRYGQLVKPGPDLYTPVKATLKIVKEHLIKLETAGLCKENSDQFNYVNALLPNFREKCKEEINRMKRKKLKPHLSLYDILVSSKIPVFARNKSLMQTLKSFNLDSFPIYKSLIRDTLEKSKSRIDLIDAGCKSLTMLVKTSCKLNGKKFSVLPVELLEQIVGFLNNKDLKSLITCREVLKHQVGL